MFFILVVLIYFNFYFVLDFIMGCIKFEVRFLIIVVLVLRFDDGRLMT